VSKPQPPVVSKPHVPVSKTRARARVAALTRHHPDDLSALTDARQTLAEAKLQDYIKRVVAQAPPLSPSQVDRLAQLLRTPAA
jgi:hypothetical protein